MGLADRIEIVGTSAPQQIADALSALILDGELQPGERLSEAGLSRSLGLSRNTVREAVRLLQGSGLVRYTFNRGLAVWDPTDADVVDVFRARLHVELAAAQQLTPETDLTEIYAAHDAFVTALKTSDPRTIVDADLALHRAIVGLLDCARIENFYAGLTNELRYFLLFLSLDRHEYEHQDGIAAEHQDLVDGFASGDPQRAAAAVTAIVEENRDLVRSVIANRSSANSLSEGNSDGKP
jgi:DNA-binding GntR family transcriptional regulator